MSTQHFQDKDFLNVGPHSGVDNTPNEKELTNIQFTAMLLEEVRAALCDYFGVDTPVFVKYGFRSQALNAAVGGSETSAHCEGLAADTHYKDHEPEEIANVVLQYPVAQKIDQLIIERGCLHFGLPCKASNYKARHELRHDQIINGTRHYPLIRIWQTN